MDSAETVKVVNTMKLFKNEEEAVSPVIGVILMVAIVVILAAVIAAFVFGMAGTSSTTKNVAMTVAMGQVEAGFPNVGIITLQGGSDLKYVTLLEYSINGTAPKGVRPNTGGDTAIAAANYPLSVGTLVTTGQNSIKNSRLILTATFADGTQQVVFDKGF